MVGVVCVLFHCVERAEVRLSSEKGVGPKDWSQMVLSRTEYEKIV
jgi:hypothetical protein